MRVISRKLLRDYWEREPATAYAEKPLSAWHSLVKKSNWRTPADIKAALGHATIRPNGRVVFNCSGNNLRIVTSIDYGKGIVFVKFVGSHAEYDAIDVDTVDHSR